MTSSSPQTTVVGSYVQPGWLVDKDMLRAIVPPRVRARDIWRVDPDELENAQDAATLAAIRDMERAGLDIAALEALSGKQIVLGVIDLGDDRVETAGIVAGRIRAALEFVEPDRLIVAPDCGMKYLTRAAAFGKLKSLAEGAAIVRAELEG
jgi:methionine synthase II (cobalamin-independent)